jgi:hypothetical protein
MFRSFIKSNLTTLTVGFRHVTAVCFLASVSSLNSVVADEFAEAESASPYSDEADSGWLDSFRSSGRSKGFTLPKYSSKTSARKIATAALISQSADESTDPTSTVPSVPSVPNVPSVEPAEPLDSLGPLDPSVPMDFSSEDSESIVGQPLEDRIQSRPPMTAEQVFSEGTGSRGLCWQLLPNGLLYKTYLAGEKEPRLQFIKAYDRISKRYVNDAVLGGRVGIVRYGTKGAYDPQGFQLDLEGAVFARVLPEEESTMLEGSDYRVGLYGTWREDKLSYRFGYYHISSHIGDEFLIANPGFPRINYVRDSALAGIAYETTESSRIYGELGYALGNEGGAEPLEFQFGGEYSPVASNVVVGAPFAAVNRHIREEFHFDGGFNVVAGWGWQGPQTGRRIRLGLNYYRGPSLQYVFFDRKEELIGGGIWLDF